MGHLDSNNTQGLKQSLMLLSHLWDLDSEQTELLPVDQNRHWSFKYTIWLTGSSSSSCCQCIILILHSAESLVVCCMCVCLLLPLTAWLQASLVTYREVLSHQTEVKGRTEPQIAFKDKGWFISLIKPATVNAVYCFLIRSPFWHQFLLSLHVQRGKKLMQPAQGRFIRAVFYLEATDKCQNTVLSI